MAGRVTWRTRARRRRRSWRPPDRRELFPEPARVPHIASCEAPPLSLFSILMTSWVHSRPGFATSPIACLHFIISLSSPHLHPKVRPTGSKMCSLPSNHDVSPSHSADDGPTTERSLTRDRHERNEHEPLPDRQRQRGLRRPHLAARQARVQRQGPEGQERESIVGGIRENELPAELPVRARRGKLGEDGGGG